MIISFFGHSRFIGTKECEEKLLSLLEREIGDQPSELLFGGYGAFDEFAFECCKKYRGLKPQNRLIFVTPYITTEYQNNRLRYEAERYDEVLYPDIEDKPLRFAIVYRNRFMIEHSDLVIAFVSHTWGGAYKSLTYAKRKGKRIINLCENSEI